MTAPRGANAGRDWDAEVSDRVADPQEAWGHELLDRLPLSGDKTVLDAGCGSRSGHRAVGRAATAEETAERLRTAVFSEVETWTAELPVTPGDPPAFLRTVVLGPHLARMPPNLHATFVDAVLEQLGEPPVLDYRRLNIAARRPE